MDIYKLYRSFWDFSFDNPEKLKPNDVAIFSFAIEHCNRLGWKKKFGFPTSMAMDAVGIKSYSVFKKHLDNLVELGFIKMIEKSKNQYSANIIALEENYKAHCKSLDKAIGKHTSKHLQSTVEITESIDKPLNKGTNKLYIPDFLEFKDYALEKKPDVCLESLELKYESWKVNGWKTGGDKPRKIKNWKTTLLNTLPHLKNNINGKSEPTINRQSAETIRSNSQGW